MAVCPYCDAPVPDARKPAEGTALVGCAGCFNPYFVEAKAGDLGTRKPPNTRDIRAVAPEGSIGGAILKAVPGVIEKLPMLPDISQRVLRMVNDPDVSMAQLADVIRQDQVIALSVMKFANSAVYGGLTEIKDLNGACARLGMKTIANTVQVVASNNIFISGDARLKELMLRLWRHSVATAHCADAIARAISEPAAEVLFLAGLLHDIGKVVLFEILSGSHRGVIAELKATPELLREVIDGFHPLIGLHVVQYWNLPMDFAETTLAHHDPLLCPNERDLQKVHTVSLANVMAQLEGYSLFSPPDVFLVTHPSARFLNLSDLKLAGLRVDLKDALDALFGALQAG